MITVLVPLANGVEEMEAVIIIDTLRRAKWTVTAAGISRGMITASRGVRMIPDSSWQDIIPASFDVLVIPGGKEGTDALSRDVRILETVRIFIQKGKWVAAVCAGPLVLQAAGVLAGRRVTCHPTVAGQLTQVKRLDDRVVVDGRLITSQGPGTSFEFALRIVREIEGAGKAAELAKSMVVNQPKESFDRITG